MIMIDSLRFSYGADMLFDGLSVTLGRITCITGPSGCGKTALLRLLAGLEKPQSGTITGVPDRAAVMFQEDRLLPWCSALRNIAAVLPVEHADKAEFWLKKVELEAVAASLPENLSGGQIRRVALARTLAFGGGILLLDEPFKGFDPELTRRMVALILAQNIPVIASVHSPEEIDLFGGEIINLG